MGRKGQKARGSRGVGTAAQASAEVDTLGEEFSDLFKILPPIKRAELTKVVEKLFQVRGV